MFTKVVENRAWDFGESVSEPVKVSSRGFTYNDRQDFVKRASAELIDKVASMELKPGEVPVHVIAVGTTEAYGPNRNGDGFSEKACEQYHPYFVKDARLYRNHKNTDTKKSYGIVKASAFNKEMGRIELILALNSNKAAADANDGLVADKEMEKLGSAKDIPVSMACTPDKSLPVLTEKYGYIPISEIRTGMTVLTKEGYWNTVTQLNRREYTGQIYEFHVPALPFPLRFTENHPLWVETAPDKLEWVMAQDITPAMNLILFKTPENTVGTHVRKQITEQLANSDSAWLITPDIKLFLQARDYCLTHKMKFVCRQLDNAGKPEYALYIPKDREGFKLAADTHYKCPITKIVNYVTKTVTVYNIEVENNPSYSAAGIISHNCKVPYDVCSCCGNKAATREEYCKDITEGGKCEAGGLYRNMGKTASVNGKIHQLYADNTQPFFFDISNVFIPADRIAYTTGIVKKSSAGIISGAELAELYGLCTNNIKRASVSGFSSDYRHALSCLCNSVTAFHTGELWKKQANFNGVLDSAPLTNTAIPAHFTANQVTAALTDSHKCLTPTQFLQLSPESNLTKITKAAEIIAPLSNEEFRSILDEECSNPYLDRPRVIPSQLKEWAESQKCAGWTTDCRVKQAALNSLTPLVPHKYNMQLIYTLQKQAAVRELSRDYALYKAAFITLLPSNQRQAMADLLVGRDYIGF